MRPLQNEAADTTGSPARRIAEDGARRRCIAMSVDLENASRWGTRSKPTSKLMMVLIVWRRIHATCTRGEPIDGDGRSGLSETSTPLACRQGTLHPRHWKAGQTLFRWPPAGPWRRIDAAFSKKPRRGRPVEPDGSVRRVEGQNLKLARMGRADAVALIKIKRGAESGSRLLCVGASDPVRSSESVIEPPAERRGFFDQYPRALADDTRQPKRAVPMRPR